jgi:hypothetical protein
MKATDLPNNFYSFYTIDANGNVDFSTLQHNIFNSKSDAQRVAAEYINNQPRISEIVIVEVTQEQFLSRELKINAVFSR